MTELEIEKPIDRSRPMFQGTPFTPYVAKDLKNLTNQHNCIEIKVDLSMQSKLDFQLAFELIEAAKKQDKKLFFVIELGLKNDYWSFFDELQFSTLRLGLKVFHEKLLLPNLENTFAIGLDVVDLTAKMHLDSYAEKKVLDYLIDSYPNFENHFGFSKDLFFSNSHQLVVKREVALFKIGMIAEYLHRLVAIIQEPIEIYAFMDLSQLDPLTLVQVLSHERFPHMRVALKNCELNIPGLNLETGKLIDGSLGQVIIEGKNPQLGFVVPIDGKFTYQNVQRLDALLKKIIFLDLPFYLLYEETMTENWQNLEAIIVDSSTVDRGLLRKCHGFAAAAGQVVVYGDAIGVFEEVNFEDWMT